MSRIYAVFVDLVATSFLSAGCLGLDQQLAWFSRAEIAGA